MKQLFFLVSFFIFNLTAASAVHLKGYYISTANDTVKTVFVVPVYINEDEDSIPDIEAIQTGLKYLDASGKKQKLKPEMARELVFQINGHNIKLVHFNINNAASTQNYIFIEQLKQGKVNLFRYYKSYSNVVSGTGSFQGRSAQIPKYLIEKKPENPFLLESSAFAKKMAAYFSNYSDLALAISNKTLKYNDIEKIVDTYNEAYRQGWLKN